MKENEYERLCELIFEECLGNPSLSKRLPAEAIWVIAHQLLKYTAEMITEVEEQPNTTPKEVLEYFVTYHAKVFEWYDKYYPKAARKQAKREGK